MSTPQVNNDAPFIPVREVISYCPNSPIWNNLSETLKRRYFLSCWPDERIRQHVAMLHAFGYNALQVSVVGQMPRNAGTSMDEWVRRVHVEIDAARAHGMSLTQFVWGNAISAVGEHDDPHPIHDWHNAAQRDILLREWERSAAAIGGRVDRVVTHWNDPGGAIAECPECRIHAAVEMHNAIMEAFRAVNPGIEGYFSNWMLYAGNQSYGAGWPGYEGVSSIVDDPIFDPHSGIALGIMNCGADGERLDRCGQVRPEDLDTVTAAGRKVAVWSWYLTDMEIQPALHVHTRLIQNYIRSLPQEAAGQLAWHTVDDCCSGLNMHNLFVAGRLMQDRSLAARDVLQEYAEGFFGKTAAPALLRALEAIEHARCRSLRYNLKVGDPHEGLHEGETDESSLPPDWIGQGLSKTRSSLKELETLSLPGRQPTAWPVTLSPEEFLPELVAHLRAIEQMLKYLQTATPLRARIAGADDRAELQTALAALPEVDYDPAHTAGLERQAYLQHRQALLAAAKQDP